MKVRLMTGMAKMKFIDFRCTSGSQKYLYIVSNDEGGDDDYDDNNDDDFSGDDGYDSGYEE